MSKFVVEYITDADGERDEQVWLVSFNYTKPCAATYYDPAEGGDFEFLTATCGSVVQDADEWMTENYVSLSQLEDAALDAVADDCDYDDEE